MDNFKFYLPVTIFFGDSEFAKVKRAAKELGSRALIITGQGSVKKHGYLERLEKYLDEEKIYHEVFEGIEPNPRNTTINKAGEHARKMKADMLIALGGGSVMDATKGAAIVAKSGDDVWDYCGVSGRKTKKVSEALPIICIPTLAATGSEVNIGAVITNTQTKLKSAIHDDKVMPRFAIIDPALTATVPVSYLVDGAVDIICHCLETYLSNKKDFLIPDYLTLGLIRTVKISIERALENPKDQAPRRDLLWASSMAMMKPFSGRNGSWPMHEIEHGISGIYDISHGFGLALVMPAVLRFNKNHNPERINRMIGFLLHEKTDFYSNADRAIDDLTIWLEKIGALRPSDMDKLKHMDVELVTNSILETYGSGEKGKEHIDGVAPMYRNDIKIILKTITV
ncbi:MAG: iron-containing alcohol dehydrogenase [Pseudomonadota bacterium]